MSNTKVKLNVLGLSYSQTQAGAYALVLSEENGERRIPIIIGSFEAQVIAIELEGLKPPRPLTHDLFVSFATSLNVKLIEVNILKLEEGIFYSELVFKTEQGEDLRIDARTSDAIALALRFKCPIYTTKKILSKAGIILNLEQDTKEQSENFAIEDEKAPSPSTSPTSPRSSSDEFSRFSLNELQEQLNKAIMYEDYERASKLRDEINRRKK